MGKLPQPRPYFAAAGANWDIGPLSRGPSSIDRILSFWIWPIQLGNPQDFEEIIGYLHNRRLQDPSNMGTAHFSLLSEGSWTPLEGTPPECSSTIYQFSMCPICRAPEGFEWLHLTNNFCHILVNEGIPLSEGSCQTS